MNFSADTPNRSYQRETEGIENRIAVIDPYVHKRAKITRDEFLSRTSGIKALRYKEDYLRLSFYIAEQSEWNEWDMIHDLIHDKGFSNEVMGASYQEKIIAFVPNALYHWLKSSTKENVRRQIKLYLATLYRASDEEMRTVMNEQIFGPTMVEVLNLFREFYAHLPKDVTEDELWGSDYDKVAIEYIGSKPIEPFRDRYSGFPLDGDWGVDYRFFHFDVGMGYFSSNDWKGIILNGDSDELLRVESKQTVWSKFISLYLNYPADRRVADDSPLLNPDKGYVYVIQSPALSAYKIGFAKDVQKRLPSLRTGSADSLKVLGTFKVASMKVEKCIHAMFADKRTNGEWFKLSDEEVQLLLDEDWRHGKGLY